MLLCTGVRAGYAQQSAIATAEDFFEFVSQKYAQIQDYTADITINKGKSVMQGSLSYAAPSNVRIDFVVPNGQTLVSDGKDLWIYLPQQDIVLQQSARDSALSAGIANGVGLSLLKRNYSVSFLSSPSPTPIGETTETGVHLRLVWKNNSEHFRELIVAVSKSGYIRMIMGTTADNSTIRFDFTNIQINQGVPTTRFDYDPPASANLYTDFLFDG